MLQGIDMICLGLLSGVAPSVFAICDDRKGPLAAVAPGASCTLPNERWDEGKFSGIGG